MTYREVEEAANRLAHLLAGHGAGPGQCVGLLLERSAEAVVAMVAVLKTGAAYLPIDPGLPAARVGFLLADAAPIAVITTAGLAGRLDGHGLLVIDVDDPAVDSQPTSALPTPAPEDIAYLIYTSGTTGVPKGVAITHHNVTQLLDGTRRVPGAAAGTRTGVVAVSFVWRSTFRCGRSSVRCCGGGRLVVVPERWRVHRKSCTPCWLQNRSAC